MDVGEKLLKLKKILKRPLYTPKELVKLGVYGSNKTILREIHKNEVDYIWVTERRVVVFSDSILKKVENQSHSRANQYVFVK